MRIRIRHPASGILSTLDPGCKIIGFGIPNPNIPNPQQWSRNFHQTRISLTEEISINQTTSGHQMRKQWQPMKIPFNHSPTENYCCSTLYYYLLDWIFNWIGATLRKIICTVNQTRDNPKVSASQQSTTVLYGLTTVSRPSPSLYNIISSILGVLGNKCAGQHNLKTVQIREIMWK